MMHSSYKFLNFYDIHIIKEQGIWITLQLLNLEFDHLHKMFDKVKLSNIENVKKVGVLDDL